MTRSPASRAGRPLGAAFALAPLGLALLLGCQGGGDPTTVPQQLPATDTWVTASALLLDAGAPGGPEFFDCNTLLGIDPGLTWTVESVSATAGLTGDVTSVTPNVWISATDESGRTAVGLAMRVDPATMTATVAPTTAQQWFFDTDLTCPAVNGRQPSRFEGIAGAVTVTLTEMEVADGRLVVAEPAGNLGSFSPAGILAGTFEFEATNRQDTPVGALTARLSVSGCFRVNVPEIEQGVPVLAAACP